LKSEYFKRALGGEFQEQSGVIRMENTEEEIFTLFVSYVYSLNGSISLPQKPGETPSRRLQNIFQLMEFVQFMLVVDRDIDECMATEVKTILSSNPTALLDEHVEQICDLQRPQSSVRLMVMKFMAASWITVQTNDNGLYLYKDLLRDSPELARDMLDAVGEFSSSRKKDRKR
jgi:hypothetical protein